MRDQPNDGIPNNEVFVSSPFNSNRLNEARAFNGSKVQQQPWEHTDQPQSVEHVSLQRSSMEQARSTWQQLFNNRDQDLNIRIWCELADTIVDWEPKQQQRVGRWTQWKIRWYYKNIRIECTWSIIRQARWALKEVLFTQMSYVDKKLMSMCHNQWYKASCTIRHNNIGKHRNWS